MKFIAELLDKSDVIDHFVEFGFEDILNVYASDDVMYVYDNVPVVLSSVAVVQDVKIPHLYILTDGSDVAAERYMVAEEWELANETAGRCTDGNWHWVIRQ